MASFLLNRAYTTMHDGGWNKSVHHNFKRITLIFSVTTDLMLTMQYQGKHKLKNSLATGHLTLRFRTTSCRNKIHPLRNTFSCMVSVARSNRLASEVPTCLFFSLAALQHNMLTF